MDWLGAFAFTLLIGGQFLAAVVMSIKRHSLYPESQTSRRGGVAIQSISEAEAIPT
jgi:hypothetical protein